MIIELMELFFLRKIKWKQRLLNTNRHYSLMRNSWCLCEAQDMKQKKIHICVFYLSKLNYKNFLSRT